ncbi:MAG TPA: hypothetical protein VJU77_10360 [Chthoniobacterales bacterium]|nr:hypothetical protein [Chthoniobacterales bacterium]
METIFPRELAHQRFALFIINRWPNTLKFVRTHKTSFLDFESRSDPLDECLHEGGAILPDHEMPSIGIILIVRPSIPTSARLQELRARRILKKPSRPGELLAAVRRVQTGH